VTRAVNDAALQKAGDIYQYLIALRDCFELNDGVTMQINIKKKYTRIIIKSKQQVLFAKKFYYFLMAIFPIICYTR